MNPTFNLALPSNYPHQPAALARIGDADPRDFALMLELWRGGPACRDAALDMASANLALATIPATERTERK